MCEGFSLDDVLALDAAHIAEYGYITIGVVDVSSADGCPWACAVGLLDRADHPELIVAGLPLATCGPILATLAHAVIGAVHEIQYVLDTFNFWHNLADYGAVHSPVLETVQVVLPPVCFCPTPRYAQPLAVGTRRPRRATSREPGRAPAFDHGADPRDAQRVLTATTSTYSLGTRRAPASAVL